MTALGDITTVLRHADPADKAEAYRQLGLRLNYQPETQAVRAEVDPNAHPGVMVRVRGGDTAHCPTADDPQRNAEARTSLAAG